MAETFCRDWLHSLFRASYRGVPFWVEMDQVATGRRLHVHEFPHRDLPYVEDLGRKANHIQVTAYLTGDACDAQEKALRAACETEGPSILVLPIGKFDVHCEECRRDWHKDKLGYIAVSMKFWRVDASEANPPFVGMASARAIEFKVVTELPPLLTEAFSVEFSTLGAPSYVSEAAVEMLQGFLAEFETQVKLSPIDSEALPPILRNIADAAADADDLMQVGFIGDSYDDKRFVLDSTDRPGRDVVLLVTGLMQKAREGMADTTEALPLFTPFFNWGQVPAAGLTPGAKLLAKNAQAFQNLISIAAVSQWASALTIRQYSDIRDARQAKADAGEYFENLLEQLDGWYAYSVWTELANLRAQVLAHLHANILDMAPVTIIDAPRSMPSLWWSWRLYGNADRGGELVARNGIKHASFMPQEFEALSR